MVSVPESYSIDDIISKVWILFVSALTARMVGKSTFVNKYTQDQYHG